jgi:metal-responsive CopG/Arc/MetJ family transcriptional regulator
MGRPIEIGADRAIGLRLPEALLKRIDGWAKREKVGKRSMAIRQLIEKGLEK